jgi:DNA uptake protein ComE-like DNA-binding protein
MRIAFSIALLTLVISLACSRESRSPDQIRQDAANATAKLKTDTKAAAEGIREGWKRGALVDINSASRDQLASLPGLDDSMADRIVAHRPYANTQELVSRRVISRNDYDRIRDHIEVKQ